jgi:hypothetical protein
MRQRLCALLVAGSIALASLAEAKTLYVNNSGSPSCSDSTTHANNDAANPWCTLGRAVWGNAVRASAVSAQAAAAGDVVLVTAGTYSAAGQADRHDSAFNPTNSGTIGNYITIQASGTVNLQLSSSTGPVIGCNSRNYIKWSGFTINEANATPVADTGPAVGNGSINCWFDRITIHGNGNGHGLVDNHTAFRFDSCDGCRLSHSVGHNITTLSNAVNAAGLMVYESDDLVIEHNEFYDVGSGVFIKGPNDVRSMRPTIRFNYVHGATSASIVLAGAEDCHVYQNLLVSGQEGVRLSDLTSTARPTNCAIYSNTIYGNVDNLMVRSSLHVADHYQNNLVVGGGNTWDTYSYANPGDVTSDRNHYHGATNFATTSGGNMTLATWQSTFSLDANSVSSDPLFANVAGGNYRLCTGSGVPHASCSGASPALTTGRAYNNIGGTTGTTIPAGAYITGNESIGPGDTTAPPAPTGFRIVP